MYMLLNFEFLLAGALLRDFAVSFTLCGVSMRIGPVHTWSGIETQGRGLGAGRGGKEPVGAGMKA